MAFLFRSHLPPGKTKAFKARNARPCFEIHCTVTLGSPFYPFVLPVKCWNVRGPLPRNIKSLVFLSLSNEAWQRRSKCIEKEGEFNSFEKRRRNGSQGNRSPLKKSHRCQSWQTQTSEDRQRPFFGLLLYSALVVFFRLRPSSVLPFWGFRHGLWRKRFEFIWRRKNINGEEEGRGGFIWCEKNCARLAPSYAVFGSRRGGALAF